jgi:hypothetical protein
MVTRHVFSRWDPRSFFLVRNLRRIERSSECSRQRPWGLSVFFSNFLKAFNPIHNTITDSPSCRPLEGPLGQTRCRCSQHGVKKGNILQAQDKTPIHKTPIKIFTTSLVRRRAAQKPRDASKNRNGDVRGQTSSYSK